MATRHDLVPQFLVALVFVFFLRAPRPQMPRELVTLQVGQCGNQSKIDLNEEG